MLRGKFKKKRNKKEEDGGGGKKKFMIIKINWTKRELIRWSYSHFLIFLMIMEVEETLVYQNRHNCQIDPREEKKLNDIIDRRFSWIMSLQCFWQAFLIWQEKGKMAAS